MITLRVNGSSHTVDIDPATPLLYILRNDLGLQGPRFGCGLGQCGACTVIISGAAVRSCITPVFSVRTEVTTLEGISPNGKLHPLQQAWIDEQVPQCGYCQSGMMIAAVDLLSRNPDPTVAQIKDAFTNTPPSPHLCRCGTYAAIIDAVQRAGKAMRSFSDG
jgi:aerobic-type carbon monoxide dehydrogenase small subunit (CoxS/CutS family)